MHARAAEPLPGVKSTTVLTHKSVSKHAQNAGVLRSCHSNGWPRVVSNNSWRGLSASAPQMRALSDADTRGIWDHAIDGTPVYDVSCVDSSPAA